MFFERIDINLVLFIAALTGFVITYVIIPTIVRMARYSNLYDRIDKRKIHTADIPRLGGMAIFAGVAISDLLFIDPVKMPYVGGFISGLIILFFVGLKDDILVISPLTKFSGQFLAATIVVFFGNTMISSLHGFFGIGDIPLWLGYVLTIFVFLVTTNAFNFIDGVDGLSASLGSIAAIAFGVWFYLTAQYQLAMVAFVLAFALFAFLRYNLFSTRNKVFMGDTGSMLIGYVLSFLAIQFNETDLLLKQTNHFFIYPAPAVAFGIMIIPYFDMLRVIYIRLIQHRNVFAPDNYHIHHLLIKLGLTHKQVTLVLSLVSIVFIFFIFWLSSFVSIRRLVLIELLLALLLSFIPEILLTKK